MTLSEMAAQYAAKQATARAQAAQTTPVAPDEAVTAINTLARSMKALLDGLSKIQEVKK